MSDVHVYYHMEDRLGWAPITHMVNLAMELFGAELRSAVGAAPSKLRQLKLATLSAPKTGENHAIYIARRPREVADFTSMPEFYHPYKTRTLWIIDSFRTNHLPRSWLMSHFDVIAYTQGYDRAAYETLYPGKTLFLGWGTDALGFGSYDGPRDFDILRIGRQPPEWDDDAHTDTACTALGLQFQGRPSETPDPADQQRALVQDWYGRTKFVIAHSNLAAPSSYTHPTKEYITGRWTDALAGGATVAGRQPDSDLALLDWPGGVLDFERINLEENLAQLQEAADQWTPQTALRNHLGALEKLDWRWRFKAIADRIGVTPAPLLDALNDLNARIKTLKTL